MEIIYFLLLMIILMLLALIISIGQINKNLIKLYLELISKLTVMQETIIDAHPNYKYKKVYESERYTQKLK